MRRKALFGCVLAVMLWGVALAQEAHREWGYVQEVVVPAPGVYRVKLSVETLSAAQHNLTDLRLLDPSGQELAFHLDHPTAIPPQEVPLQSMRVTMERDRTVIAGEVPALFAARWFQGLTIHTQAPKFLKPVTVETSKDGERWVTLVQNHPVHRQEGHPPQTHIPVSKESWTHWRITLDDSLTLPLPVERVTVSAAGEPPPSLDRAPVQILGVATDGRHQDYVLLFPAARLMATLLRLETPQPVAPRKAALLARTYRRGAIQEEAMVSGTLRRVPTDLTGGDEQLALQLSARIPSREMVLRIASEESSPLEIAQVLVEMVPTYVVFQTRGEGSHRLLVGNAKAEARLYEVSRLKEEARLANLPILPTGPLTENPGAPKPGHVRDGGEGEGTPLDLSGYAFRKKITVTRQGVHRLELDPEVLGGQENRTSDLRILRAEKQIPYLLDHSGLAQFFEPAARARNDDPRRSVWVFTLPGKGLPVTHLSCSTEAPSFRRAIRLVEEVQGKRGETVRGELGKATWSRRPGQDRGDLILVLSRTPQTERLILEVDNGDHPPLPLTGFRLFYKAPKLLFRASPGTEIFLYYGNPAAASPRYEVDVLGPELVAAEPLVASLSSQEVLKPKSRWGALLPSGVWQYGFWIVMGGVVLALLAVIRKLLPSQTDQSKGDDGGTGGSEPLAGC